MEYYNYYLSHLYIFQFLILPIVILSIFLLIIFILPYYKLIKLRKLKINKISKLKNGKTLIHGKVILYKKYFKSAFSNYKYVYRIWTLQQKKISFSWYTFLHYVWENLESQTEKTIFFLEDDTDKILIKLNNQFCSFFFKTKYYYDNESDEMDKNFYYYCLEKKIKYPTIFRYRFIERNGIKENDLLLIYGKIKTLNENLKYIEVDKDGIVILNSKSRFLK